MSPVDIKIANANEWNVVCPMGEMEATKAGRYLNPPLKFTVTGLRKGTLYEPRVYFLRSDNKYSYGSKGFWAEWTAGEEKVPLQYVSLGPMDLANSAQIDFSKFTISTDKETTKRGQLAMQSHHAYFPKLVITSVTDPTEVYEFTDDALKFVVVTKATPRLKKLREELKKVTTSNKRGRSEGDGGQGARKRRRVEQNEQSIEEEILNYHEDPSVVYIEEGAGYYMNHQLEDRGNPIANGVVYQDYQVEDYQEPALEFDSPNQEVPEFEEIGYEDYEGPLVLEGGEQIGEQYEYVDIDDQEIRPDSRVGSDEQEAQLDMDVWNERF